MADVAFACSSISAVYFDEPEAWMGAYTVQAVITAQIKEEANERVIAVIFPLGYKLIRRDTSSGGFSVQTPLDLSKTDDGTADRKKDTDRIKDPSTGQDKHRGFGETLSNVLSKYCPVYTRLYEMELQTKLAQLFAERAGGDSCDDHDQ